MIHTTITALKENRYRESYAILSKTVRDRPCLYDEWEFQTEFCGLDRTGERGFEPQDAEDIYRWLCHAFFPSKLRLPSQIKSEEGLAFVRDFAKGSVIRSPLGYVWAFEDPDDAVYFKLRYYG